MKLGPIVATLVATLGLVACGAPALPSSPPTVTATPTANATPTPIFDPAPTVTPTLIPTPTLNATPTPAPEPPLAVLSQGEELKVVNTKGVEQFELSNAAMMKIFGVTAAQEVTQGFGVNTTIAGSNIYIFYVNPQGVHQVAEVSRAGKVIALGTGPASAVVFSPSGTQWAWSIDQSPANQQGNLGPGGPYYQHHGVIEVGGLGQPTRTVYKWLAPSGFSEQLDAWTNTGIIVQRWEYGGCGLLYDPAAAWFVLNPSNGKLTELFTGNDQFLGASSGDTVAALINDSHAVLINGVKYAESKSSIYGAYISPDGVHVAITRLNQYGGCGPTKYSVEMVTVANQSHVDLQNLYALGWWSDNQFVANTPDGSAWLYTLAGKPVSEICPVSSGWGYDGILS